MPLTAVRSKNTQNQPQNTKNRVGTEFPWVKSGRAELEQSLETVPLITGYHEPL